MATCLATEDITGVTIIMAMEGDTIEDGDGEEVVDIAEDSHQQGEGQLLHLGLELLLGLVELGEDKNAMYSESYYQNYI